MLSCDCPDGPAHPECRDPPMTPAPIRARPTPGADRQTQEKGPIHIAQEAAPRRDRRRGRRGRLCRCRAVVALDARGAAVDSAGVASRLTAQASVPGRSRSRD